jgi:hypothetical protein
MYLIEGRPAGVALFQADRRTWRGRVAFFNRFANAPKKVIGYIFHTLC